MGESFWQNKSLVTHVHFQLKSLRNKKDFNDFTAAPFLVSFSQLPPAKKNTKKGEVVMSLRSFLFRDNFMPIMIFSPVITLIYFKVGCVEKSPHTCVCYNRGTLEV